MNYEIDQQKLSERIYAIIKTVAVPAGLYIFLSFILLFFIYAAGLSATFGSLKELLQISDPQEMELFMMNNATEILLLNMVVSVLSYYLLSGVYGMISAGLKTPIVGLGSAYKALFSKRGFKVLCVIILIQAIVTAISFLLNIFGLTWVGFAIGILIQFLTYFSIPSIYIDNKSIGQSLRFSTQIINQKPEFLFFMIAMTYVLSFAGILLFGIGIIFTLPLNYIVAHSLYATISEQINR